MHRQPRCWEFLYRPLIGRTISNNFPSDTFLSKQLRFATSEAYTIPNCLEKDRYVKVFLTTVFFFLWAGTVPALTPPYTLCALGKFPSPRIQHTETILTQASSSNSMKIVIIALLVAITDGATDSAIRVRYRHAFDLCDPPDCAPFYAPICKECIWNCFKRRFPLSLLHLDQCFALSGRATACRPLDSCVRRCNKRFIADTSKLVGSQVVHISRSFYL